LESCFGVAEGCGGVGGKFVLNSCSKDFRVICRYCSIAKEILQFRLVVLPKRYKLQCEGNPPSPVFFDLLLVRELDNTSFSTRCWLSSLRSSRISDSEI
jgi:hypothetical protein